jgi:glycosyltransferase involved in cell wall biosynthesis
MKSNSNNVNISPLVTFIVAVYNCDHYLSESLKSLQSQTYNNFKIIIVDDNSTDRTYEILEEFIGTEKRAQLIKHCKNMGRSASRNRALYNVDTEYVAILDADDIALPERLQKQIEFMQEHPETDILGCGTEFINSKGESTDKWIPNESAQDLWQCLITSGPPFAHSSVLFRTAALKKVGGYRPQFVYAQDYDLYLRLGKISNCAALPDILVQYRVYDKNTLLTRRMHQARLHLIALASWVVRYTENTDFIDAIQDPISADIAEELANKWKNKTGWRVNLAWISILINIPLWPNRDNLLLYAWIDAAISLTQYSDYGFVDSLIQRTINLHDNNLQIAALINTFQYPICIKLENTQNQLTCLQNNYNEIVNNYNEIVNKFESEKQINTCIKKEISAIYNSKSWKVVYFLRKLYNFFN